MKDPSRRHTPSPRGAPYRKRRPSVSPSYLARRRAHERDASRSQPRPSDRARDTRPLSPEQATILSRTHNYEQPVPSKQPADNEPHSRSKTGGKRATSPSRSRKHGMTSPGPSQRAQPSGSYSMSAHADVPGPPLRIHLAPTVPAIIPATGKDTTSARDSGRKTPSPESVDSFLRSIKLPDKPSNGTPISQPKSAPAPVASSSHLPTSPTAVVPKTTRPSTKEGTSNQGHQLSLVYKGFSFTYDLSTLPDDPTGTIALLRITDSDPGAYILIGAHYRRTGRSRAACAIIRSLLSHLNSPSDVEQGKDPQPPIPDNTPEAPDSPIDLTKSVFKSAAMRPAMLLLAACEMDISREDPTGPGSVRHAAQAHDLFRAVYGTVNDAIIAGAVRPPLTPKNALGLEFSSNQNNVTTPANTPAPVPASTSTPGPPPPPSPEARSAKRIRSLERELDAARDSQKRMQDKLSSMNEKLLRVEDRTRALERHSHDTRVQLDASREENLVLRQRLAEAERRASEPMNGPSTSESRVLGKLRDLLLDSLGGGARSE